jgi:hypothetical protein
MKRKRKRKRPDLEGVVLGVAWYSPAEWERLREAVPDPERLENSYEEWEGMALSALAQLEEAGITPERVPVEAEQLLAWCRDSDREPDSAARAQFAADRLRQRDPDGRET